MLAENLSHYHIIKKLGSGRVGEVYLAQDTKLGRTVALKILHSQIAQDPEIMSRFMLEAKIASTLDHPNVAHIYEVGEADGVHFIAMQYVEGDTLSHHLKKRSLSAGEILDFGIQMVDALEDAHSKGISHGELNSSNIIITTRGSAKVLDFGVAKILNQVEVPLPQALEQERDGLPPNSDVRQYLSPEQKLTAETSRRSDIYSLGVILYRMATNRLPFASAENAGPQPVNMELPPESITRLNRKAPQELDRIVQKCLEKDPDFRYQTASDLLVDLKNLQRDFESSAARMTGLRRSNISRLKKQALWAIGIIALALSFFVYKYATQKQTIHSLAVLPFVNINQDANMEYLSDGITETAINSLSQLPHMKVLARGTVFTYKGKQIDPLKVGEELDVDAVVMGTIQQQGQTLTIQASLVNARDGVQLWGERYNRPFADLMAIQTEMSKEITRRLRLTLTGQQKEQLNKTYTRNMEAYQLYLKGRYYLNMRTREGFEKAIDSFEQAIRMDPKFAQAYAGLSDSYSLLSNWGFLPSTEGYPKAKAASLEALQLDDSLAEAFTSLASIQSSYEWNWEEAEKNFKRAIVLNPNYVNAHHWYSFSLSLTGRHQEALAEMKEAVQLDPLSLILNANLGYTLYVGRKYDEAIEQLKNTIDLDPNFAITYQYLGYAYEMKGNYARSIEALKKATSLAPDNLTFYADLARAYAVSDQNSEAEKMLNQLQRLSSQQYVAGFDIASIYTGMGEKDKAVEWLNKAYDEHSDNITYIKMEPRFDSLRSDPRFIELIRRVRLS